jgi:hypothetical protein
MVEGSSWLYRPNNGKASISPQPFCAPLACWPGTLRTSLSAESFRKNRFVSQGEMRHDICNVKLDYGIEGFEGYRLQ